MAKAEQAYHKGTVDRRSVLPNPFHIGGATMNGSVMTLARYYARQAIKRELYGQGIKLASKLVRLPALLISTSRITLRSSPSPLNSTAALLQVANCDPPKNKSCATVKRFAQRKEC